MAKWNYWTFGESVARAVTDACGLARKPSTSLVNTVYEQRRELYIFVRTINVVSFDDMRNAHIHFHRDNWMHTFEFVDLCDDLAVPSLTAS